jgi:heptaprenyl diphosphate synthase
VIAEKTGSLIATAGRYGGMFSGCTPEQIESLHRFGSAIGFAFQISDDIIDITSPSASSGKTPGTDLREGVLTLPMLYALQDTGAAADRLRVLLARPITDDGEVDEALELLRTGPGVTRAQAVLAEHASAARTELAQLPDGPAGKALASLTTYVVARTA